MTENKNQQNELIVHFLSNQMTQSTLQPNLCQHLPFHVRLIGALVHIHTQMGHTLEAMRGSMSFGHIDT